MFFFVVFVLHIFRSFRLVEFETTCPKRVSGCWVHVIDCRVGIWTLHPILERRGGRSKVDEGRWTGRWIRRIPIVINGVKGEIKTYKWPTNKWVCLVTKPYRVYSPPFMTGRGPPCNWVSKLATMVILSFLGVVPLPKGLFMAHESGVVVLNPCKMSWSTWTTGCCEEWTKTTKSRGMTGKVRVLATQPMG